METRICKHCEMELPLTLEYFSWANTNKNRFLTVCRDCKRIYNKEYMLKNNLGVQNVGDSKVYTVKEEPVAIKNKRIKKALDYIYLQAFGEEMNHDIYWCKKCDNIQLDNEECFECSLIMEKIGFVEYNKEK